MKSFLRTLNNMSLMIYKKVYFYFSMRQDFNNQKKQILGSKKKKK